MRAIGYTTTAYELTLSERQVGIIAQLAKHFDQEAHDTLDKEQVDIARLLLRDMDAALLDAIGRA